jgi:hypothetical protein
MKTIAKIALALATAGTCAGALADTAYDRDQERRARNREEAIANWERMQHDGTYDRRYDDDRADYRERHDHRTVGEKVEHAGHKTERAVEHAGQKTENFTERQMDKVRRFGERQQDKFHQPAHPAREDDKRPSAMGK